MVVGSGSVLHFVELLSRKQHQFRMGGDKNVCEKDSRSQKRMSVLVQEGKVIGEEFDFRIQHVDDFRMCACVI